VGDRGHRKGQGQLQLRVLGSPPALHAPDLRPKEPRAGEARGTGRGGGESAADPISLCCVLLRKYESAP
jgi:hypothetical protein